MSSCIYVNHQAMIVNVIKISVLFSVIYLLVRMIVMMEYLNIDTFFNMPDADMKLMLEDAAESPPDT